MVKDKEYIPLPPNHEWFNGFTCMRFTAIFIDKRCMPFRLYLMKKEAIRLCRKAKKYLL